MGTGEIVATLAGLKLRLQRRLRSNMSSSRDGCVPDGRADRQGKTYRLEILALSPGRENPRQRRAAAYSDKIKKRHIRIPGQCMKQKTAKRRYRGKSKQALDEISDVQHGACPFRMGVRSTDNPASGSLQRDVGDSQQPRFERLT
jgi:hypothetical protein